MFFYAVMFGCENYSEVWGGQNEPSWTRHTASRLSETQNQEVHSSCEARWWEHHDQRYSPSSSWLFLWLNLSLSGHLRTFNSRCSRLSRVTVVFTLLLMDWMSLFLFFFCFFLIIKPWTCLIAPQFVGVCFGMPSSKLQEHVYLFWSHATLQLRDVCCTNARANVWIS